MDSIERWLKQSEDDLVGAKHSVESNDFYIAVFLCQQAIEKALKALYINQFGQVVRSHDLFFLGKKLGLTVDLLEECKVLNSAYIESRYPDVGEDLPSESYNKEDADDALKTAGKVIEWVKEKI